jgi:hypothetical protein
MRFERLLGVIALLAAAIAFNASAFCAELALDTARIEKLTGLKGTANAQEGVFKVSFPRKDIAATVAGVRMIPDLGLSGWAAFTRGGDHVMVMGDIVLLENEINPVMSAALDNGLEVTALHNHFAWDSPRIFFMHIGGMGNEERLASAVGQVFGTLKKLIANPLGPPTANIDIGQATLDTNSIEQTLGAAGTLSNGVYKVVIGRKATMGEHQIGKEMGVNTWAAFAGNDQRAVVDGDFAMLEGEVQGVLKALRAGGINVVAIHNHMIGESPRYVFLHYWGIGPVRDLASTLKTALETQSGR